MKKKKYSLFIGRWQPFHKGHAMLVQTTLDKGKNVCIAIRDTNREKDNPYSTEERHTMIRNKFPDIDRVAIITIPDIEEIVIGRKVGYGIREVKLGEELEAISGTKTREGLRKDGKLKE